MAPELRVLIAPELRVAHRELGQDQHARVRARVVLVDARGVGRAGVAAEREAALVLLAHDPLERDEVHAVAEGGDHHRGRHRVQRDHLLEGDGGVQVVDRHIVERAVPAVDLADEGVEALAELLVERHVQARGDGDLHEDDLADVLGVRLEQPRERQQLVRDPLDRVEAVDPEEDLCRREEGASESCAAKIIAQNCAQ